MAAVLKDKVNILLNFNPQNAFLFLVKLIYL